MSLSDDSVFKRNNNWAAVVYSEVVESGWLLQNQGFFFAFVTGSFLFYFCIESSPFCFANTIVLLFSTFLVESDNDDGKNRVVWFPLFYCALFHRKSYVLLDDDNDDTLLSFFRLIFFGFPLLSFYCWSDCFEKRRFELDMCVLITMHSYHQICCIFVKWL